MAYFNEERFLVELLIVRFHLMRVQGGPCLSFFAQTLAARLYLLYCLLTYRLGPSL